MANGFKIGEVSDRSALVWVRLTQLPERVREGIEFERDADAVPEGRALSDMQDSVEGVAGQARVSWWPKGGIGIRASTGWEEVDSEADHTAQLTLGGLRAGVDYEVLVEGRSGDQGEAECAQRGAFTSAQAASMNAGVNSEPNHFRLAFSVNPSAFSSRVALVIAARSLVHSLRTGNPETDLNTASPAIRTLSASRSLDMDLLAT